MTRADVKTFIETGINELSQSLGFGTGRLSEFNSKPDKHYPFAWLESLSNSPDINDRQLILDNWHVAIYVAKQDMVGSSSDEYEGIINDCDEIAKSLLVKYNLQVIGYKLMKIESISIDPFVKMFSDCLSGVSLSFVINVPDLVNRC